jgi:hypothetical protein
MGPDEWDGVAAVLGSRIRAVDTLAGGFSHETCLLTLADGQVVARLGGADPIVEAAVMASARRYVPVPQVWRVIPGAEIADGARSVMICEYVAGTPLSQVLSGVGGDEAAGAWDEAAGAWAGETRAADGLGGSGMYGLGAEVGRVVADIGRVTFERPGFFTGEQLAVSVERPWSQGLPEFAAACMGTTAEARLDAATRRSWVELCVRHAPALRAVDDHRQLVHADINPKNILVSRAGAGWTVDAVLDWEFSYSGCSYGDAANMARFPGEYPASFLDGFRAGFVDGHPAGDPQQEHWGHLGRVLDMFALSDLVTRPPGHPTAAQAAEVMRRWVAYGVPRSI